MADRRRPALGTARPKPARQDVVLNVSKVASNSYAGAPGIGQDSTPATGSFLVCHFSELPGQSRLSSRAAYRAGVLQANAPCGPDQSSRHARFEDGVGILSCRTCEQLGRSAVDVPIEERQSVGIDDVMSTLGVDRTGDPEQRS